MSRTFAKQTTKHKTSKHGVKLLTCESCCFSVDASVVPNENTIGTVAHSNSVSLAETEYLFVHNSKTKTTHSSLLFVLQHGDAPKQSGGCCQPLLHHLQSKQKQNKVCNSKPFQEPI
jgi:hypothetical protein